MSIVRDARYSVTTRAPCIEVQDQQIRADIYLPQMQVDFVLLLCLSVCVALKLRSLHFAHPVYVASRYFQ